MCKSSNEPGGPYRCSGDMKREYDRATNAYGAALERTAEPYAAQTMAQHNLERARSMKEAIEARDYADPDTKAAHLDVVASAEEKAEEDLARASRAVTDFQQRLRDAGKRFVTARADYDATPQGVAELQAEIDALPAASGDREELDARRVVALDRMNEEGAERRERWGQKVGERVAINRWASDPRNESRNTYAEMAAGDKITACATNHGSTVDPVTGEETNDFEVTFYRPTGEGKVKQMRVTYRESTGHTTSQADVLAHMSEQAALVEGSKNYREYCRTQNIPAEQREAERARYDEGKRYAKQMRGFLGDDADKYLRQAGASQPSSEGGGGPRVAATDGNYMAMMMGAGGKRTPEEQAQVQENFRTSKADIASRSREKYPLGMKVNLWHGGGTGEIVGHNDFGDPKVRLPNGREVFTRQFGDAE